MTMNICRGALFFLIGVAVCLLYAEDGQAQGCRVTLKNGSVISSSHCYEENGVVYLSKLGGTLGMHRADVARIEKIRAEETEEAAEASVAAPAAPAALPAGKEERMRKLMSETRAESDERRKVEKKAVKAAKAARAEEERPFREFKSQEEALKSARNNEAIACGRASEPVPRSSGPISGEQAAAFIKTRHDASEGCDYYRKQIPRMEKKLEELRVACGSKCR